MFLFYVFVVHMYVALYYIMDELKRDDTTFKLLKVIEDKGMSIKWLSNRLEGYYTCTRVLLERINSNLVESQISGVQDKFDSYEQNIDKLVRRTDLFESNLNQHFNTWGVVVVNSC